VLSLVPINLDVEKVRTFSGRCAELRNEISHFGSQRHGENYQEFVQELTNKSEALSLVYHMLILHEIGIEEKVLKWWIYEGPHSYRSRMIFAKGGLVDKSALKPAASVGAGGLS
jgi:hypothetical protein